MTIPNTARPGVVYALLVRHHVTGTIGIGYVGQTRQHPRARLEQHQASQPFGDLIVGIHVIEQGMWDDAELDLREMRQIRLLRPWHNIIGNMDNPDRIPPWTAIEARQRREPGWVPPPRTARVRPVVQWTPQRRWAVTQSVLWIVAAAVAGVWTARLPQATVVDALIVAPGVACAVMMFARQQVRAWSRALGRKTRVTA